MEEVLLKDIIVKAQPRVNFDSEKLYSLKKSVEKHGIKNPLILGDMPEGLVLVDGERRYRVATELGLKKVPAIIEKYASDVERAIVQFNIQEQHEAWSPLEKAQSILDLSNTLGVSLDEVCDIVGITSDSTRKTYAAFASLAAKEVYLKNEIPLTFAPRFNSITNFVKKIVENDLGESFNHSDAKVLQNNLIKMVKGGNLKRDMDFTKIKDSLTKNPKIAKKLLVSNSESITPSEMFAQTKARGAYHLRNAINNAMYVTSHTQAFLKTPDVKITPSQFITLKETRKAIDKLLDLE